MPVLVESLSPTKVSLTIEVEADKVKAEREKVFQEMAKGVQLKGFRKGKAPRKMVEKAVNQDRLNKEVLERVISQAYGEALKENEIRPVAAPQLDVVHFKEGEPLKFKAVLECLPKISLPDYKGMEVSVKKLEVQEEEVEKTLETLREQRSTYEDLKDGVIQEGVGALLDFHGFVGGKPFEGGSWQGVLLEIKKDWPLIPGFMEKMFGMKGGEDREIRVTMPPNFEPEIAGKEAVFKVHVHAVKQKKKPGLDEAFAQSFGTFKTIEELKEAIRGQIKLHHESQEKSQALEKALLQLGQTVDFPVPEIFVEERLKQFERETLQAIQRENMQFSDYLKRKFPEVYAIAGVSEEEKVSRAVAKLREEMYPEAVRSAKIDLILDEISHKEKLHITQEEMNSEVRRMAETFKMSPDAISKALQKQDVFQNFVAGILRAKAALLVRENLKISYHDDET